MNPDAIPGLPAEVVEAVRLGLADQLHWVFIATFPMLAVAFVATLLIKYIPLQETVSSVEDARRELLDTMSQSSGRDEVVPGLGSQDEGARTRERIMALNLALLLEQSDRPNRVLLRQAVEDLGKGNLASGQSILARTVEMLSTDDPQRQAATEKFAVLLDQAAAQKGGVLSDEVRKEIAVRVAANKPREEVLSTFESTVADNVSSVNIRRLRYATNDLTTALLMDLDRPGAVHTDPTDGLPSDAIRAEERHPGETSGTVTVEIPKEDS